jgi:hypothetical protein
MVLDMSSIRRNHGDPAVDEGGDADAAVGVEGQRIEALKSADPGDKATVLGRELGSRHADRRSFASPRGRRGPGLLVDDTRLDDVEGPQPRRLGFRDIERLFIG